MYVLTMILPKKFLKVSPKYPFKTNVRRLITAPEEVETIASPVRLSL